MERVNIRDFMDIDTGKLLYDDYYYLSYIKEMWGLSEKGKLTVISDSSLIKKIPASDSSSEYYRLTYIEHPTEPSSLDYPIDELDDWQQINRAGLYISKEIVDKNKQLSDAIAEKLSIPIRIILNLSSSYERKKHQNPIMLYVTKISIQEEISESSLIYKDGKVLVNKSLLNHFYVQNENKISQHMNEQIQIRESLEQQNSEKQAEVENLKAHAEEESINISKLKKQREDLQESIKELRILKESEEMAMSQKLEKLKSFIKDKVELLEDLGLLDEDDRKSLLGEATKKEQQGDFLSYSKDLDSDIEKLIEYIQAYLYNKNIVYSRYLLENFFALIQTNDLIILAGESGSGKTNLIKSFADVIGGVCEVIPVKPNWTSSDDLLGYYNPLTNKFIPTLFTETLVQAANNPETPYFICLDEMNLARVEYYFADFLSLLEKRDEAPIIRFYSDDASAHIMSEFKNFLNVIEAAQAKYNRKQFKSYLDILTDPDINQELRNCIGSLSDSGSLLEYHSYLRKCLNGLLNIPPYISFPANVRIIGAINVDETTHFLSSKILDRAHVIKFENPLLYINEIEQDEIQSIIDLHSKDKQVRIRIDELGVRGNYPQFDKNDEFCDAIIPLVKNYISKLGVDFGLRAIRQGLNYMRIKSDTPLNLVINDFVLYKILPKFSFDGAIKVDGQEKIDVLSGFREELSIILKDVDNLQYISAISELDKMIERAKHNNKIVNYWV